MAFVQGKGGGQSGAATLTVTFIAGVTPGNTVWGIVTWDTAHSLSNVKLGGVLMNIKDNITDSTAGQGTASFILGNVSGAPTSVVATFSGATSFTDMVIIEESGCAALSDPTDVHVGQNQGSPGTGSNAVTSGNVTTTVSNDIIVGMTCATSATTICTAGTGFTRRTTDATEQGMTTENGVTQVSPGLVAATFTTATNTRFTTLILAIQPSGSGGSSPTPIETFVTNYW